MPAITTVIIALVAGGFGGFLAACFCEAYFARRAAEEVGEFDKPEIQMHMTEPPE